MPILPQSSVEYLMNKKWNKQVANAKQTSYIPQDINKIIYNYQHCLFYKKEIHPLSTSKYFNKIFKIEPKQKTISYYHTK